MRRLFPYLSSYKKECVLAPLFKMLEAIFELFVPLVMARIIDIGITNADKAEIARMCGLLLLLAAVGLASSLTAQFFAAKAATGFSARLRHALFEHIGTLSFSRLDTIGTSTLITRMTSDINQAQAGVNMTLRLFLRSPFIVFGAMIMAFQVNAGEAMIFAVTIPVLALIVLGIMALTMPLYRKVQSALDAVLLTTSENLEGVRVLRAFRREKAETLRFDAENERLSGLQRFVGRLSGLMNPLTLVVVNAATIVLLYTGAIQVDAAVITQGELTALVNYMSQILVELVKLANLIVTISKALSSAGRVADILEIRPDILDGTACLPEHPAEGAPAVAFENVSLKYAESGEDAISEVSFRADPGETIGIIGGTGSGKSTVVNLIPRFYDVTEGRILINGVDVKDCRQEDLRCIVGMVPQKALLFRGSIADNLRWGNKDASYEEMKEALIAAQAWDFVSRMPQGMESPLSEGGKNLSGGQRQRLTIARALVRRPRILILDDSASALDFATDARLRAAIRSMPEDMTVFIVSQRAASVMHADKILVMENGRISGTGTHEELLKQNHIYREIYESQFKTASGT